MGTDLEFRATRQSVFLTATLTPAGMTEPSRYRVMNVSSSGMCIAKAGRLDRNSKVNVSVGAVKETGKVVWVRGDLAGIRFDHPIDLQEARKRSPIVTVVPTAGWVAEVANAYRK